MPDLCLQKIEGQEALGQDWEPMSRQPILRLSVLRQVKHRHPFRDILSM